ncbi:Glucose-6-phosphate [Hypsibius exemplaris]|uniref:Glucose-6-phosphate n=1 Tax=Hypsibius exemplaris TaxID=2072580 RepID=A0A1W0WRZ9_HYPEX|nr:Glucose-6-phosphate [Hypsibius exemplaris]
MEPNPKKLFPSPPPTIEMTPVRARPGNSSSSPMATSTPLPENPAAIPYGIRLFRRLPRPSCLSRIAVYRILILLLTYFFYVAYHLARRPLGVVKNVLAQTDCSNVSLPQNLSPCDLEDLLRNRNGSWCSWEPFGGGDVDSKKKFSALDFTYRFSYAAGMIVAGHIAERTDLRLFVSFGMVMAGMFAIFNGMAYFWEIHAFSFFVVAQLFGGIFQGTGWPAVVPLMGNWFGKKRLGIIFGIWNSHTSVGNILGAVIAGVWVNQAWGYSFVVPGLIIMSCGIIAYFFVVVCPEDVGLPHPDHSDESMNTTTVTDSTDVSIYEDPTYPPTQARKEREQSQVDAAAPPMEKKAITMWQAVMIPGVIEFSLCLFFSKAVYYTFFFWLPVYIKQTTTAGNQNSADLSAVFDAGGIIGGIIAGAVSDATGGSATVCGVMFVLAIPSLYCMVLYVGQGFPVLITLLVITGLFVNGPYALITTAVSTDLGTRPSLVKNTHALATVAAVIDGMGSLGSAFGPLGAGLLSTYGWHGVFYFLIASQVVALLCLTRLIYREVRHWQQKRNRKMSVFQDQQPHLLNGKLNEKSVSRTGLDDSTLDKSASFTNGGRLQSSPV